MSVCTRPLLRGGPRRSHTCTLHPSLPPPLSLSLSLSRYPSGESQSSGRPLSRKVSQLALLLPLSPCPLRKSLHNPITVVIVTRQFSWFSWCKKSNIHWYKKMIIWIRFRRGTLDPTTENPRPVFRLNGRLNQTPSGSNSLGEMT
jgi:hypothetical protein